LSAKLPLKPLLGRARQAWLRRPQLTIISSAMVREARAVRAGHEEYKQDERRRYLLRRNVHMIEKGLTMEPRRDTFATDYIQSTVEAVRTSITSFESEESIWILSVLSQYFDATRTSASPAIRRAAELFHATTANTRVPRTNGPQPVRTVHKEGDFEALRRLANGRRSVRWFTGEPVPRTAVDAAISIAIEAPSACNRSPYRFEIFDAPTDVASVADLAMGTRGYGHQITGLVVVVGLLNAFFDERDRHLIYIDSSLATMSLILGFQSQGIASCIINWPDIPERDIKMRKKLGLTDSERPVMLVAYGYPRPDSLAPHSGKQSLDEARVYRSKDDGE
jgi:nitroreductase